MSRYEEEVIQATRNWVKSVVIQLNLCPFAHPVFNKEQIRFKVSGATTTFQLLQELQEELALLSSNPSIETTLLIHPQLLNDFPEYNDFLDIAEQLIADEDLEGIFQIASFHPDYQFSGTAPDDAENFTNRSPYPMLHVLREDRLSEAIDNFPDPDQIPKRNITRLNELGAGKMLALLKACFPSNGS